MNILTLRHATLIGLFIGTAVVLGEQGTNSVETRVENILNKMTLDEKLSYIGGTGFFDIKPIPVQGLSFAINPQIFQTDGPNGSRMVRSSAPLP
jgi:beta-glucosidase